MSNSLNRSVSPTPIYLSTDTSYLVKPPMPTELALADFNRQSCVHWNVERLWIIPLGEALHRLHFFINCSYVRVLFGNYGPEYTIHFNNYGHNNHISMRKYHSFPYHWHYALQTYLCKSYDNKWSIKFCIDSVGHNMTVGITPGSMSVVFAIT